MASCLEIGWLDILHFWSSRVFIGMQKVPKFSVAKVAPCKEAAPSWTWKVVSAIYMYQQVSYLQCPYEIIAIPILQIRESERG